VRGRAKTQDDEKEQYKKETREHDLASVKWEMQQPRLTESVRNEYEKDQVAAAASKKRR
jgi:hypothetical protein